MFYPYCSPSNIKQLMYDLYNYPSIKNYDTMVNDFATINDQLLDMPDFRGLLITFDNPPYCCFKHTMPKDHEVSYVIDIYRELYPNRPIISIRFFIKDDGLLYSNSGIIPSIKNLPQDIRLKIIDSRP